MWFRSRGTTTQNQEVTKREQKRAARLVRQIAERFANPTFISARPPDLLAADLKVTSLLLRAGLSDKWLSEEDYLAASVRIWLSLFFNAGAGASALARNDPFLLT